MQPFDSIVIHLNVICQIIIGLMGCYQVGGGMVSKDWTRACFGVLCLMLVWHK